ncbi:MAG: hypothetical protein AAF600_15205 [Bacteroidota bacterium]
MLNLYTILQRVLIILNIDKNLPCISFIQSLLLVIISNDEFLNYSDLVSKVGITSPGKAILAEDEIPKKIDLEISSLYKITPSA